MTGFEGVLFSVTLNVPEVLARVIVPVQSLAARAVAALTLNVDAVTLINNPQITSTFLIFI